MSYTSENESVTNYDGRKCGAENNLNGSAELDRFATGNKGADE